jgi:hypothetical protein
MRLPPSCPSDSGVLFYFDGMTVCDSSRTPTRHPNSIELSRHKPIAQLRRLCSPAYLLSAGSKTSIDYGNTIPGKEVRFVLFPPTLRHPSLSPLAKEQC